MDLEKATYLLGIVAAVLVALPLFLRGLLAFLKAIPGNQGEAAIEKVLMLSEKVADMIVKLYPKARK